MKYVFNFGGGVTSWLGAQRIVRRHGPDNVTLLFADTLIEDVDLYRFLVDCSKDLGVPITRIADGRTPWQVFKDERYLGNTRVDPCSRVLKRELLDAYHTEHFSPKDTVICVGLSWDPQDKGRYLRFRSRMRAMGWRTQAPLFEEPHVTKLGICQMLRDRGIDPPDLTEEGFPHNNCGGFCIKAGHAHYRLLLAKRPAKYAECEANEEDVRQHLGKDVAILRDRTGGTSKPMTLRVFRERVQAGEVKQCSDWGGCGCAV